MNKGKRPLVSLVIPVYNETERLVSGVYHIVSHLVNAPYTWELIIVDDGSSVPVRTVLGGAVSRNILRFPLAKLPIRIYRLSRNWGKGHAIGYGVAHARGTYVVFSDADLSVPISNLPAMLENLKKHAIVIASRRLRKSKILVHQSLLREAAGRIFTILSNALCATGVADATCGFKGFQRDAAKNLFAMSRIHRWVFDTEIIFLGRKHGYTIFEMPVDWANKAGSKVRIGDSMQALYDLLRIRWYDVSGKYNK